MIKYLYNDTAIRFSDKPFYNYNEGSWTFATNYNYKQTYYRGQGNPLNNFINQLKENINNFILDNFSIYGIEVDGLDQINNFKNDIINLGNNFYNSFINNKNIIDTTLTPLGEYVYDGGRTTASFELKTSISINYNKVFMLDKKNKISILLNAFNAPQLYFKLSNININSVRW